MAPREAAPAAEPEAAPAADEGAAPGAARVVGLGKAKAKAKAEAKAKAKGKAKPGAAPARGAVLAKAAPKPKAKGKAVPKAKAAGPARGAILAGGAPKAIAAKEFAAVAAKAKAKADESPPGSGTWYFMSDLRKTVGGADDDKAWTKYDAKMNKQLEMAYSKGFKQFTMTRGDVAYIVKFKTMMQFRADDKSLQRPVKRV
mmetsp:Transcript_13546/g.30852  ORF Transcript_13546/g.30852 Transcript_13546/m.30852 type:complete len:200 (+) Transcript_13546:108-707(+)